MWSLSRITNVALTAALAINIGIVCNSASASPTTVWSAEKARLAATQSTVTRSLNYVPSRDGMGGIAKVNYWPQDVMNRMPNWLTEKLVATSHYEEFENHLWYMYYTWGEWAVDWYYIKFSSLSPAQWNGYRSQLEMAIGMWEPLIQGVCTLSEVYCSQDQRYEAIGALISSWVNKYLPKKKLTAQVAADIRTCRDC